MPTNYVYKLLKADLLKDLGKFNESTSILMNLYSAKNINDKKDILLMLSTVKRLDKNFNEAQELISENNDLIYSSYDELSAEIDERIELFRKKLEERENIIRTTIDKLSEFEDDITDNKQMIVENTQEIHQAFEAIIENTEMLRHTKETLTKRLIELYGPY